MPSKSKNTATTAVMTRPLNRRALEGAGISVDTALADDIGLSPYWGFLPHWYIERGGIKSTQVREFPPIRSLS
jgi:hypothetical protein